MKIPDGLVEAIKNNHAIALVGSGFSIPAGGPSWEELLYELIAIAEDQCMPRKNLLPAFRATRECDFLQAADLIHGAFSEMGIKKAIVEALSCRQRPVPCVHLDEDKRLVQRSDKREPWSPTESHRTLLKLRLQAIITTNYDHMIEEALGVGDRVTSYSHGSFNSAYSNLVLRRFILHLHGDIYHELDIVFSKYDYRKLFHRAEALHFLGSLLNIYATLWLGFGHGDPDVVMALKKAGLGRIGPGYQVVTKEDLDHTTKKGREFSKRLKRGGITPIVIDSYDEMPQFLSELAQRTGAQPHLSRLAGIAPSPRANIADLNADSRAITECFLAVPLARLPRDLANPRITLNGTDMLFDPDSVFGAWAKPAIKKTGRQVAIVAPAAAGKSVLLSRFGDWLWLRLRPEDAENDRLSPIVFFLTPDNLPEALTRDSLWNQVESWVSAVTAGYVNVERPGLLTPWRDAGAVYLLFDGLDEFGARRKGELECLLGELCNLAKDHGVRVFLTCREVFWSQQLLEDQRMPWEKIEIRPFAASDLQDRIADSGLGSFAYDASGKPKPRVLNHLVLSFVLALPKRAAGTFPTRHSLYKSWAAFTIERECKRLKISPSDWPELFEDTGLKLLREMKMAVPLPTLRNGDAAPYDACMEMEILVPSSADRTKVKFRHESINEFFVSSALAHSFRRVLRPHDPVEALADLPLAQVELDFPQTSLYGFLHEELGDGYLEQLKNAFSDPAVFQYQPEMSKLHRNMVEYVGMTYAGRQDQMGFTNWLLRLMRDPRLDWVVRYNAARALERIHPWAPKPYFDYMSDWGDGDWKKVRNQAKKDGLRPWAIRGFRVQEETDQPDDRKPGTYPALAVVKVPVMDGELQRCVSEQLGQLGIGLLEQLATELTAEERRKFNWLLINYTHAWVRWHHPEDRGVLADAQAMAKAKRSGVCLEAKENLETWVGHPGFRFA